MFDSHYIKTLTNGLLAKIKSIRSDWEVNDPSQEGYVKNRTHWSEVEETVLLPEKEYAFVDNSNMGAAAVTWYYTDFTLPATVEKYKVGDVIIVSWDGIDYDVTLNELWNAGFVGNLACYFTAITGSTDYPDGVVDTGEPFFMMENICGTLSTSSSHTIGMTSIRENVHKLDKKYLPDDILPDDIVTSVNGQIGDVYLTASDVGALPNTTVIISQAYVDNKIATKQDKLIGKSGQVVGFDNNGNAVAQDAPSSVPDVTTTDNGKFLRVVDGAWSATTVPNAEEVAF